MNINTSRRNFLRGLAGTGLFAIGGCKCPFGCQKVKLAAVGVMGKGYSDWVPMLKSGFVEIVAFCDCDYKTRERAQQRLAQDGVNFDMYSVPFYTDYRRLLDDAGVLGIEAMTVSTTDHTHAPIAIGAMKQGIHVYVQKPLVRTLYENKYFYDTAKEYGVITQMGNQGSSISGLRRAVEVLNAGILGDVKEVHVWTNRPVWPQGKAVADWVKSHPKADKIRPGLNWDCWLATAKSRPFLDVYPKDANVYDPWNLGKNVYHSFTWRGFYDFGCGAFGDMACHTMNLPFRGLELAEAESAELLLVEDKNDVAYPLKSKVKLVYSARESKARPGVKLPAVDLYWYDGNVKPSADLMPQVVAAGLTKGEKRQGEVLKDTGVPHTGCLIIGSKGILCSTNDYGGDSFIALKGEKMVVKMDKHPACTEAEIARRIPYADGSVETKGQSTVEMKGFAEGHYGEFINAIRGVGPVYEQTDSRCFSDVDYSIPQMEGILIGCVAQRVGGKLRWNPLDQKFDVAAANEFVRPYIRKGFEF